MSSCCSRGFQPDLHVAKCSFESGISHLSVSHSLQLFVFPLYKIKLFLISDKISSNLNQVHTGLSTHFRSTHKKHTHDAAQRDDLIQVVSRESSFPLSSFYTHDDWLAPVFVSVDIDLSCWSVSFPHLRLHTNILFTRYTTHAHLSCREQIIFNFSGEIGDHARSQDQVN